MSDCPCRQELLERINEASFAVDEAKLFLDTHPCDEKAMDYFEKYSQIRNASLKEYAKYYGPLTVDSAVYSCKEHWDWINKPWPWQEGEY